MPAQKHSSTTRTKPSTHECLKEEGIPYDKYKSLQVFLYRDGPCISKDFAVPPHKLRKSCRTARAKPSVHEYLEEKSFHTIAVQEIGRPVLRKHGA